MQIEQEFILPDPVKTIDASMQITQELKMLNPIIN